MRRVKARTIASTEYSDPGSAIRDARLVDRQRRSIPDQEVSGRRIERIVWVDTSLALELDDQRYLHCTIENRRVSAALSPLPLISEKAQDGSLLLELETGPFEWDRAETADRYVGCLLRRLWFLESGILMYVDERPILACYPLELLHDEGLIMFWTGSD